MQYDAHSTLETRIILSPVDSEEISIENGDFSSDDAWVVVAGWALDTGENEAIHIAGAGVGTLLQSIPNLTPGFIYRLSYDVVSFTSSSNDELEVFLGGLQGVSHNSAASFDDHITAGVKDINLSFVAASSIDCVIKNVVLTSAVDTNIIDTKGFGSLEYFIQAGERIGGFTTEIEQGDTQNLSDAQDVPTDEIIGTPISFDPDEIEVVKRIGDIGKKRYHRLRITNAVGENVVSGMAVLRDPRKSPTE